VSQKKDIRLRIVTLEIIIRRIVLENTIGRGFRCLECVTSRTDAEEGGKRGKVRSVMPRIIAKRLTESDTMTHKVIREVHHLKDRNTSDDVDALSLLAASFPHHMSPCIPALLA
jgi:hypothetical protein